VTSASELREVDDLSVTHAPLVRDKAEVRESRDERRDAAGEMKNPVAGANLREDDAVLDTHADRLVDENDLILHANTPAALDSASKVLTYLNARGFSEASLTQVNSAVSSLFPPMGGREIHGPTARGRPLIAWSC
jgi:hypothetical protein